MLRSLVRLASLTGKTAIQRPATIAAFSFPRALSATRSLSTTRALSATRVVRLVLPI